MAFTDAALTERFLCSLVGTHQLRTGDGQYRGPIRGGMQPRVFFESSSRARHSYLPYRRPPWMTM